MPSRADAPRPRGAYAGAVRDATAPRHRQVEQRLDVRTMFASTSAYRDVLVQLLGFHRPLEPPLAAAAAALDPPLPPVARAERLADDLRVLGADPAAVPECQSAELPALDADDAARTVGVLYVVEGSALGGAVLARLAERRLGLTAADGSSFFSGDRGPAAEARWGATLGLIEAQGAAGALAEVIAGARDAFDRLDAWLVTSSQLLGGNVRA